MDCDIVRRQTRSGRTVTQLILLPDADISDPENESDSDYEQVQSSEDEDPGTSDDDDLPLAQFVNNGSNRTEEDDDDGDGIPLAQLLQSKSRQTVPSARTYRWRKMEPMQQSDTQWKGSYSDPPDEILEPIEYFNMFFQQDLFTHIAEQTNIYAVQSGSNFRTSATEVEQLIGILMKMGLVSMPRYRLYWSKELRFPAVADIMSRNRFDELNKYLHFNDNTKTVTNRDDENYDRFYKVRPLLNMLREACLKVEPEEKHSVDEQMIPFKGKNSLKQYLPKKPKKWGFKVLARCGVSGITYDFHIYDGRGPNVQKSCGYQSGDFVLKLSESLPPGQNFKLYFDNWFTFLELQLELRTRGIWSVGTIRSNRLRGCNLKSEKELKETGRGSVDMSVDANSGIVVVRWLDNSAVQLSSTHAALEPMTTVQRWDRKAHKYVSVSCPAIIREYNEHMGGVDLFDMLMSLYRVDHKSIKWYRRVFLWAINVAVVNGWLLYRRHFQQQSQPARLQLDLIHFTAAISEALIYRNKVPPMAVRKRGRPLSSATIPYSGDNEDLVTQPVKRFVTVPLTSSVRFDNIGHLPAHSEPKQRCKVCQSYVRLKCVKCGVHLCITNAKNCYIAYHTK